MEINGKLYKGQQNMGNVQQSGQPVNGELLGSSEGDPGSILATQEPGSELSSNPGNQLSAEQNVATGTQSQGDTNTPQATSSSKQTSPIAHPLPQKTPGKPAAKKKKTMSGLMTSVVILGGVNLALLASFLFLLTGIPGKAQQIKLLRSQSLKAANTAENESLASELVFAQNKVEQLAKLYPTEAQILNFVEEIDKLKARGIITHFSFANDNPVKDRNGYIGLPIVIEFRGSWLQISQALEIIQKLPFLIRAIDTELSVVPADNTVRFKFGGILYVSENFGKG